MSAMLTPSIGTDDKWEMKKLLPWHKQLCSMLAQGIDRQTIAQVFQKTPEYISMLAGQDLIRVEVNDMKRFAEFQLEAQFVKSVSVIGEVLENGSAKEKIQAARLQLEATRRIGPRMVEEEKLIDTNARLARLAERLLSLQGGVGATQTLTATTIEEKRDGQARQDGQEAEDGEWSPLRSSESAQDAGDGLSDSE